MMEWDEIEMEQKGESNGVSAFSMPVYDLKRKRNVGNQRKEYQCQTFEK